MTTIQQMHAEVWAFRREMERYFPTPSREDSLAFAFTEAGEAVDAQLRQNPLYKRNNAKEHSVERELAQCAMMLLTAVPELKETEVPEITNPPYYYNLPEICYAVGVAYISHKEPYLALHAVRAIVSHIDLPTHLTAELERMRTKHGPVRDAGPASLNEPTNEHIVLPGPNRGVAVGRLERGERAMTPYQQGKNAHTRGTKLSECPYFDGTVSWRDWRRGWYNAERAARK